MRAGRAAIVVALVAAYCVHVFQLTSGSFRTAGIGDWIDPYFINGLLEHWYGSVQQLSDPASPPMYFPVKGTLGYSHGLALFAAIYAAIRPFVHPFQAYTLTLVAVLAAGALALHTLFRRVYSLGFVEAVILTACFSTSQNVVGGATGAWSQRASVFLIPPLVLLLVVKPRIPWLRSALAGLAGLLTALLFVQDYYTAQFALFFAVVLGLGFLLLRAREIRSAALEVVELGIRACKQPGVVSRAHPSGLWLVVAAASLAWAVVIAVHPFEQTELGRWKISARDPGRPALISAFAAAWYVARRWRLFERAVLMARAWRAAALRHVRTLDRRRALHAGSLVAGAFAGLLTFVWIYLPVFREHSGFSTEELARVMQPVELSARYPIGPLVFAAPYASQRTFLLAIAIALTCLVPGLPIRREARRLALWCLALVLAVFVVPLRINGFSLWMSVFHYLPGFAVIRDPQRIIQVFELAAVLMIGSVLAALPARSVSRWMVIGLTAAAIWAGGRMDTFAYAREISTYERFVEAPIAVDSGCRSFFIRGASDSYMARSGHMWSLYAMDATFIAMRLRIPTLNGYSAWTPKGWGLANPQEPDYLKAVDSWILAHQLSGVCALDIEARTMTPYRPRVVGAGARAPGSPATSER